MPTIDDEFQYVEEPSYDPQSTTQPGGFAGSYADIVYWGIYNGVFAKGPPDPSANIDVGTSTASSNWMPNWRFIQSSNTAITAKQIRDTASPSGSNLRFTIASGAAADEAFMEQIVDIGGSRMRAFSGHLRAWAYRSTGTASFQAWTESQLLDVDGTPTGDRTRTNVTVDGSGSALTHLVGGGTKMPPARAKYLRVRVGMARAAAGTTATGSIDFAEVRFDRAFASYDIPERTNAEAKSPGYLAQQGGIVYLSGDATGALAGVPTLSIGSTGGVGATAGWSMSSSWNRAVAVPVQVPEIAAPATPDAGFHSIYSDTSGVLRTVNDAGAGVIGVDNLVFPATQVSSSDPNTLDDYEEGTWTPTVTFVTPGNLNVVYATRAGFYTKIGNTVQYNILIVTSTFTHTTASGNLRISGLPFTSSNATSSNCWVSGLMEGYTKAGYTMVSPAPSVNSTNMIVNASGSGVAQVNLAVGDVPTGSTVGLRYSGMYFTPS